jgi:hypothetical protein
MGLARGRTPWIGVSYRSWLTFRPSRKPVVSAKDRLQVRRIARLCARGRGRSEAANPALRVRPSAHELRTVALVA